MSATASAEGYLNLFCALAEGVINTMTKYNWNDAYSGLNTDVQGVLATACASYAAMMVINYDTSSMTAREAETRLDFLRDMFERSINVLEEVDKQKFATGA